MWSWPGRSGEMGAGPLAHEFHGVEPQKRGSCSSTGEAECSSASRQPSQVKPLRSSRVWASNCALGVHVADLRTRRRGSPHRRRAASPEGRAQARTILWTAGVEAHAVPRRIARC